MVLLDNVVLEDIKKVWLEKPFPKFIPKVNNLRMPKPLWFGDQSCTELVDTRIRNSARNFGNHLTSSL